jgi:hypothetical protein
MRKNFEVDVEVLGELPAAELAELSLQRAAQHGFTRLGACWQYLSLMLVLGSGFDEDPLLPWARQVLTREGADPEARLSALLDASLAYLDEISGTDGALYLKALRRACALRRSDLAEHVSDPPGNGVDALLRVVYPRKHAVVGRAGIAHAVRLAEGFASEHGLGDGEGVVLSSLLVFLLGAGFSRDPAHRWVDEALRVAGGPAARCDAAIAAASARLERALHAMDARRERRGG